LGIPAKLNAGSGGKPNGIPGSSRTPSERRLARSGRVFPGQHQDGVFSYISPEERIPPERLLRALLVQILWSIRSERLLKHAIAENFFGRVLWLAEPHLSDEHFTVDGTLIEAWASQKSFRPKDGSDDGDGANFHGTQRKHDTHQSTTDPDAKLYRMSSNAESKLSCLGQTLGSDTAGRFRARVRGSSSGDGADGGCVAQFGKPGSGPGQRRSVEFAARETPGHHRDSGATVRCQPLWNLISWTRSIVG
jgi:hypothetical protein